MTPDELLPNELLPNEILKFWFDRDPGEQGTGKSRRVWFIKDAEFDRQIQTRFQSVYQQAAAGNLDHWQETPTGMLALIILLDQFPRNLFRGDARSFATDDRAVALAEAAIAHNFDQHLSPVQRWFLYIPFMHSETLEHQRRSVQLFSRLKDDPDITAYPYAIKHMEVIERFGRFPHRNAVLGRATTPEEAEFLKQPGSSF